MNPWHGKRVASAPVSNSSEPVNSRWLALLGMLTFSQQGIFVAKTLDELFARHQTPPRDRRLATELASETVRRSLSLDQVLARYVVRPRESVEPDLWLLLRLGVCQLLCLQHIPVHAAVHETVELCEKLGKPRAKGFVNGTLRTIERERIHVAENERALIPLGELTLENLTCRQWPIVRRRGAETHVLLEEVSRDIFADPRFAPLDYVSDISGLPAWLLQRWEQSGISHSQIMQTALWFTTPGRISLRVNQQLANREELLESIRQSGVTVAEGIFPESVVLEGSTAISELPGFQEGLFSVQDESAMRATALLNPQPGESILDLCAAPGGKTCHIAERLAGTGRVVACDVSPERLGTIHHNVERLKLKNVETFGITAEGEFVPPGPYDAALVDVPCSNTGVLGKRPEARTRLEMASFRELVPIQIRLLNQALDLVKQGGRVVYSTCSIDPEENQGVVRTVLSQRKDAEFVSETLHWPGSPADGGYQALIVRKGDCITG